MKKGNQFYLEIMLFDNDGIVIDIKAVSKIHFNIADLTKVYDGTSEDVTYDETKRCFKVYLAEKETFKLNDMIRMDARVLYKNNLIDGTDVYSITVVDAVKEELLNVEAQDSQ